MVETGVNPTDGTVRVTVSLPRALVARIDALEPNRSRFVHEALVNELQRRRQAALALSIAGQHPERLVLAEAGLAGWGGRCDESGLLDSSSGQAVSWEEGRGWQVEDARP